MVEQVSANTQSLISLLHNAYSSLNVKKVHEGKETTQLLFKLNAVDARSFTERLLMQITPMHRKTGNNLPCLKTISEKDDLSCARVSAFFVESSYSDGKVTVTILKPRKSKIPYNLARIMPQRNCFKANSDETYVNLKGLDPIEISTSPAYEISDKSTHLSSEAFARRQEIKLAEPKVKKKKEKEPRLEISKKFFEKSLIALPKQKPSLIAPNELPSYKNSIQHNNDLAKKAFARRDATALNPPGNKKKSKRIRPMIREKNWKDTLANFDRLRAEWDRQLWQSSRVRL